MPRFHIIYRSSPGENQKGRPSFYSKELALSSFLSALEHAPAGDRIFVNDGALTDARADQMRTAGRVVQLPAVGNCRSYRACIGLVETADWADDDLVYMVEDDYLHLPHSLTSLVNVASALRDVDYFTLYNHPDYYALARHRSYMMLRRGRSVVDEVEWRSVRSTCLTYGARVGALRQDSWVHYLCSRPGAGPQDDAMWAIVTGAGPSLILPRLLNVGGRPDVLVVANRWARPSRRPRRRSLYVSRPSLATHLEAARLGLGTDWEGAARMIASPLVK